jgi:hypothetical protein
VTSGGNPVTSGTVTFTENGVNVAGGPTSPVTVSGSGQASFSTTSLVEGDHNILATYNGVASTYALSFGNKIQRVDNGTMSTTTNGVTSYCNPGTITIPSPNNSTDEGDASPNPSNIFVAGAPGTINHVTITLNGVDLSTPYYLTSLLVGPLNTTANSLDFFSDVGSSTPMSPPGVNVTLDDTASSNLSTGDASTGALVTGSFKPTSGYGNDTFFASTDGFYTPPSAPYRYAAPIGSSTLDVTYDNQNPNGTWSLYLNQINQSANSSMSSWCVNLTENAPVLAIQKSHSGNFSQGQTGAQYSIVVTNPVGPGSTGGTVTVTDNPPAGMTVTGMNGNNWTCSSNSCTRSDALAPGGTYDTITVTVNVSNTAGPSLTNQATVSGGGTTSTVSSNDQTTINPAPFLFISKSPIGTFKQGQTAEWDVTVGNTAPSSTTNGTVTVTDTLPMNYTIANFGGTQFWSCSGLGTGAASCTTTQAVSGGSSFSVIQIIVNVPAASPISVTNNALAYGGGDQAHTNASNAATTFSTVTVVQVPASVTVTGGSGQSANVNTPFAVALSAVVKDANGVVVPNYTVVFAAPNSGPSGTFSNSTNTITASTGPAGTVSQFFTANDTAGGPYNVSATAASASANFSLTNIQSQFVLTTAANPSNGGTVTPTTGGSYNPSTGVPITATPAAGYAFVNWTSNPGSVANSTSASTTITMNAAESVTANFQPTLIYPSSLNFGNVYLNSKHKLIATITNDTSARVIFTGATITLGTANAAAYTAFPYCDASPVKPGSSCEVAVDLEADAVGTLTATLNILDNAAGSPQQVSLTANVINPLAQFQPSSLSFGTVAVNASKTIPVQLTNVGGTDLDVTNVTITGSNSTGFSTSNPCPASLAPTASCTIDVTFAPLAKGARGGSLAVTDNVVLGKSSISISGTGH